MAHPVLTERMWLLPSQLHRRRRPGRASHSLLAPRSQRYQRSMRPLLSSALRSRSNIWYLVFSRHLSVYTCLRNRNLPSTCDSPPFVWLRPSALAGRGQTANPPHSCFEKLNLLIGRSDVQMHRPEVGRSSWKYIDTILPTFHKFH